MNNLLLVIGIAATSWTAAGADLAPALQWITATGGSGNSLVASAAADRLGNLYIVGSTTSLDFPTTGAATQASPGGSTLARVDLPTGIGSRLYPANLPKITSAAADPSNPGTLYAAAGGQIWQTNDGGLTWDMVFQFPGLVSIVGLAVDPATPTTIYAGTTTVGLQKSTDGGLTWTAMNQGIPPLTNGSISVRSVWVDPGAPNVIFASTGFGLARSENKGETWILVAPGDIFSLLAFDPFTDGTLYFGSGNSLSVSIDNGATFVRLSSVPNQAALFAVAADPRQPGVLYAGTSAGIYQSSDKGTTWFLKLAGVTRVLVSDPNSGALIANSGDGIVRSDDGFATTSPVGPKGASVVQLLIAGQTLFEISTSTADVFAIKLDGNGNIVYSTYFGGNGNDAAVALAVGSDGSIYVVGTTNSADLPVTPGAYLSNLPSAHGGAASFVFKLDPTGSLRWATYFTETAVASIAVDSTGDPLIGGWTSGGLPTTPGAYQTDFHQSVTSNGFFTVVGPTSGFVTKFNSTGAGLVYSTYVSTDNNNNTVQETRALAVDGAGKAFVGVAVNSSIAPVTGTPPSVVELDSTGSVVVASTVQPGLGNVTALALDSNANVYVAGSYTPQPAGFPATPGAFQSAPQPAVPVIPYQAVSGGGMDAFVAKWDNRLSHLLAATLLGGELPDVATSVAVDAQDRVIVAGYTDSKAFPTHAPFQASFSSRSGFVAALDSTLSNLLFSTYLGDGRPFAAYGAVPDGKGNILLAGSTLSAGTTFLLGGDNGASFSVGNLVVANKIALAPAPSPRLDSVQNYASRIAQPLAPGEPILALGAGFGTDAHLVFDGTPLATLSASATAVVAVLPDTTAALGVHTLQISNGTLSNSMYAPAAAASPAIYTVDGSGAGQGYILNSDGTLNSPTNPAATASKITIFVAGEGQYTLSNGYAVTAQTPSVFVDGFYCNGVAAVVGPVNGLPGNVYQLEVIVPDPAELAKNNPDLKNFKFPPQSGIQLTMGPGNASNFANSALVSQSGVFVSLK